jgi:hypothetical protein
MRVAAFLGNRMLVANMNLWTIDGLAPGID